MTTAILAALLLVQAPEMIVDPNAPGGPIPGQTVGLVSERADVPVVYFAANLHALEEVKHALRAKDMRGLENLERAKKVGYAPSGTTALHIRREEIGYGDDSFWADEIRLSEGDFKEMKVWALSGNVKKLKPAVRGGDFAVVVAAGVIVASTIDTARDYYVGWGEKELKALIKAKEITLARKGTKVKVIGVYARTKDVPAFAEIRTTKGKVGFIALEWLDFDPAKKPKARPKSK